MSGIDDTYWCCIYPRSQIPTNPSSAPNRAPPTTMIAMTQLPEKRPSLGLLVVVVVTVTVTVVVAVAVVFMKVVIGGSLSMVEDIGGCRREVRFRLLRAFLKQTAPKHCSWYFFAITST